MSTMNLAASPPKPDVAAVLAHLAEDAFFTTVSSGKLDVDALRSLAQKRTVSLVAAAHGRRLPGLDAWEPWILPLCAALAPIAPPRWVPFADAVSAGLSLEHGARGVRALFTSKPSEKEVARVRSLGGLAVRAITSVLTAAGPLDAEGALLRRALIASLGLADHDRAEIEAEPPVLAEALALTSDVDGKIARRVVRAGFYAARVDGTDPREDQAVVAIGRKLGLTSEEVVQARDDARAAMDAAKDFGEAAVDGVRYVLADEAPARDRFALAAARLGLTKIQRHDAMTAIQTGVPVVLTKRHRVDRRERAATLALAWLAVVHDNPTYTRSAELSLRHDRLAADLGDEGEGASVRSDLNRWLEVELAAVVRAAAA